MAAAPAGPILFVSPWLKDGGIERSLEILVPWLARRGHRVEVVSWFVAETLAGQPNPVLGTFAAHGIRVRRLRSLGRLQLLQRATQLAAIAVRGRYRIIVGAELMGNLVTLLATLMLGGRPRAIATIHNAANIHTALGTSPALLRLARYLYGRADGIVAVCEDIRRDTAREFGVDPDRIATIFNPVDLDRVRELSRASASPEPRALAPFVVACGRLAPMKGFPDLIRAFARVRSTHPALKLVLLGDGPERQMLVRCAEEAGVSDAVLMLGFTPNPFPYFAHACAFVLSSRFGEAFSRVLVEAMICGAPVVASRCQWGPEEILDGGKYGLLYEVGDVEGLATHLSRVIGDQAAGKAFSSAARQRVQDFAAERVLPRLAEYYRGVA